MRIGMFTIRKAVPNNVQYSENLSSSCLELPLLASLVDKKKAKLAIIENRQDNARRVNMNSKLSTLEPNTVESVISKTRAVIELPPIKPEKMSPCSRNSFSNCLLLPG